MAARVGEQRDLARFGWRPTQGWPGRVAALATSRPGWRGMGLLLPAILFLSVCFAIPMLQMLSLGLSGKSPLEHYSRFLVQIQYSIVLLHTVELALTVTAICLLLGYPVAYALAHVPVRWANLLMVLVILPFFTSFLVRAYAWMVLLGRAGLINQTILALGVVEQPIRLLHNTIGVHVGMVHALLPFMILPTYSVMRGIDLSLIRAAQSLGGRPAECFWRVYFPLSLPGVWSGAILVFIVSLGFFITPALLGGPRDMTLAMLIEAQVNAVLDWGFAAALATALLIVVLALLGVFQRYLGLGRMIGIRLKVETPRPSEFDALGPRQGEVSLADRHRPTRLWTPPVDATVPPVPSLPREPRWSSWVGRLRLLNLATGLVLVFLILPIVIVMPMSFSASEYLRFPPPGLSMRWYNAYFGSARWINATLVSLRVGLLSAGVAVLLGTLASFGLVRSRFRGRGLVLAFVLSPMIIPVIITSIALYFLFSRLHLTGTLTGLVLGHTVLTLPYVLVVVSAALQGFDEGLERAARSLGAGPLTTFRRVTLPLLRPAVLSGALLAFVTSFDELLVSLFLAGPRQETLPMRMWASLREEINPTIAAISTLLVGMTVVFLISTELLRQKAERLRAGR